MKKKDDEFVLDSSAMDIQLFSYTYKKQDTTITDTLVKIDPYNKAVTTSVKNVLQERLVYDTIINLKRLSIIEKDFIIRNRIDKQIKIIQKQEQADAENNIAEIQNISTKAINKIFIVFLIILLACLCLYGLLVLDTYRIKRYEQSLIREKQNYRDLADNRSEFLSMMAHELRTPLQSIIGFSDLLHNPKNKAANKSPHYSEIIKKSSSHLLQTINLLLDRSKIDAGKIELEHIPFNLSECLYEVFESLSIQASEKPFLYTIDSDIPVHLIVNGDSFRLKQVLYNLLSNAIKFTNQGKVSLTCRLIQDQEDSVRANFKIADTGIGIPKEKIKKLFEKYEQLDKSTVRLFGGTGLGLVITKKILELFHSYLTVQSNENTGTTFLFNLTFEKSKAVPPISPPELIHTHATLLIIDDDNYSLLYAYQLIHESFESVYIASSIADGLQIIENNTPDIILCDLHVNNILGTTLLDYIEEKTKIIFTSADHDYLNKLKKQNFHILPKPFTGEDLINALNSLKVSVQLKNYTSIPDIIHIKSLLEKITLLEQALKENDIQSILYYLHQLKTTLGYLNHWEEIKLIQKEESAYALYMKADAFKQSIALILPGLKDRYSR
ncbi:MAG: ATP-binding response regulator [Cytophaga sp.]|uniref:ATP-binding response regulator n=1 Tax=Cytophaga sp. TaxID=29535 RepID=UPI003F7F2062